MAVTSPDAMWSRYIVTFDQDRSALAAAYAQNALFSCRIHDLVTPSTGPLSRSKAELFVPQNQTRLPAGECVTSKFHSIVIDHIVLLCVRSHT